MKFLFEFPYPITKAVEVFSKNRSDMLIDYAIMRY